MSQVLADLFFSKTSAKLLDFLVDEYRNNPEKDHSKLPFYRLSIKIVSPLLRH